MLADYTLYETGLNVLKPFMGAASLGYSALSAQAKLMGLPQMGREFAAAGQMLERSMRTYPKPAFNLPSTTIHGNKVAVSEEIAVEKPYGDLLHFARDTNRNDPKVLLVAPMSGHYATLLRGTVEALLPYHDVYITDWKNARDVSERQHGSFGLDTYVTYVKDFLHHLGPDTHVVAVCQPVIPVMAAISHMAADNDPDQPLSMTLMGGPVDTRINPTKVNDVAKEHSMFWFRHNALSMVPYGQGFANEGNLVYPGFKQLGGFIGMNLERHRKSHEEMYMDWRRGDHESAAKKTGFYDEYLAVMDIPADFYLQTVEHGFKRHSLPKRELMLNNQLVDPGHVRKTALLTIEGGKDDISAVGQTFAAHALCNNLSPEKHFSFVHPDAGHYGIFEGRRWRDDICPRLAGFIRKQAVDKGLKLDEIPGDRWQLPTNLGAINQALTSPSRAP